MSLAHNGDSQLADSNTGETEGYLYNNGLSPLGREAIAGDELAGHDGGSVASFEGRANMEAMRISKAPGLLHRRILRCAAYRRQPNMDDEQLLAPKKNGGVVQIVGFASGTSG